MKVQAIPFLTPLVSVFMPALISFRRDLLQENRPFFREKAEMSTPARGDGDFLFCRVGVKLGN
ncbi:MAG TPA: hypothetical protein VN784_16080 [Candidatus Limnocylindrales bacterium]|nr:hypothetical protein [Candidatus Limnocylindrales bacterium]